MENNQLERATELLERFSNYWDNRLIGIRTESSTEVDVVDRLLDDLNDFMEENNSNTDCVFCNAREHVEGECLCQDCLNNDTCLDCGDRYDECCCDSCEDCGEPHEDCCCCPDCHSLYDDCTCKNICDDDIDCPDCGLDPDTSYCKCYQSNNEYLDEDVDETPRPMNAFDRARHLKE